MKKNRSRSKIQLFKKILGMVQETEVAENKEKGFLLFIEALKSILFLQTK